MPNKFFLIDGHAQIFRSFYSIPPLTSLSGIPVNAVYGFTAMLRKLIKNKNPYYIAVAFDVKGPTFRHEMYKNYKANRKTMPDELIPQIPLIEKVVSAYNIPVYLQPGFEADDVIGTLVKILSEKGIETIIVTKDKDMEQLIDDNVKILDFQKDTILDLETFKTKREIEPNQMIEVLALAGDSADNVPGVPGIGYKTAIKLIKEWDSVEGVLSNIDKIRGKKTKENLTQFADQARLSRELVTINTKVPINFELENCRMESTNNENINKLFREFGFTSFLN